MKSADIYLNFKGNAEAAMNFYKKIFGGDFIAVQRYSDVPGSEKMAEEDKDKLMHISLRLTEHTVLMATDAVGRMELTFGNNFHICLNAESEQEADRLYESLSANGRPQMPMNKTFWGAYFGMCKDQFDVNWMINFQK